MTTIPASGLDRPEGYSLVTPHAAQKVHAPDHPQRPLPGECGQCTRCHPGKAFGGDSFCHAIKGSRWCECHRLPADEVSASSLLSAIRAAQEDEQKRAALVEHHQWVAKRVADFEASLTAARNELTAATEDLASLPTAIADIESLDKELANVEETNATIRTNNQNRARVAQIVAKRDEYKALTAQIEQLDKRKTEALAKAEFPVPGLGFDETGVTFNAVPFSQASSAEQIRVSLAIAIALNPGLKVIRILDGSLLDEDGMRLVDEAAKANDYQVWIERVGDSGSVGIVIEDGQVKA